MSHVKAGGSSKNIHDSQGQRLGLKLFGGQKVKTGMIIARQTGLSKTSGVGTFLSRNYTIHAAKDGIVTFNQRKVRHFSGKTVTRTEITVK